MKLIKLLYYGKLHLSCQICFFSSLAISVGFLAVIASTTTAASSSSSSSSSGKDHQSKNGPKLVFTKPLDIEDSSLTYFEILEPSTLRYMFKSKRAKNFGTSFNQSYSSVELFLGEPANGCSRATNANKIRGNSVLFIRGDCSFLSKAVVAEEAGAMFVLIADNDVGSTTLRIEMVHDDTGRKVSIPALLIAGKDGAMIQNELNKQPNEAFALMNIPVNLTHVPLHKRIHPPWTLI